MTRSRHQPSSVLFQLALISLCLSVCCLGANYFKQTPDIKISLSNTPTAVRISNTESEIAVGLYNGTIVVYYINGTYRFTLSGCHTSQVKDIREVRGNGWISYDNNNTVCRWNSSNYILNKWLFSRTIIDISLTYQTNGYAYFGVNFGDQVYEYYSQTYSTIPRIIYNATSNSRFTRIQYSGDGQRLFIATNATYVYSYNCSTGSSISTVASTTYNVNYFTTVNNGDIVFTDGYYLYRMNASLSYNKVYISGSVYTLSASYKNSQFLFIVRSSSSSSNLQVYDSNGSKRQNLSFGLYSNNAIDASANYLVYVSNDGVLGIVTYAPYSPIVIDTTFPIWAVILISVSFVFIVIIVIVILVVRARKRRTAMAANGYNRFNETQGTNQYFPNPNLPYNPVSPQPQQPWNNQNQGWNNQNQNQGWNNQNQNQGWNNQNQGQSQNQSWNNQNQGWNNQVPSNQVPINQVPINQVPINQVLTNEIPNSMPVEPVVIVVQPTINPYQANQPSNWS